MELNKKYLTYGEYIKLGGTLDETPFNILQYDAQKTIDQYTFGRLQNIEEQNDDVKMCIYQLINIYNSYDNTNVSSKAVASESIDGYSVSYAHSNEGYVKAKENEAKAIVKKYLANCKLENGVPYLYIGADVNAK